jgi:transposase
MITTPSERRSPQWPPSWASAPRRYARGCARAEIDSGQRQGTTSEESAELKRLRRENAELRRANEILKAASAFFAAELDRPGPR